MPKGAYVRTEEHRRINSEAQKGKRASTETRRRLSEVRRGKCHGKPARGFWISGTGYKVLTSYAGHPLSNKNGTVYEHRKVLYEKIGAGPHECHWNHASGCGKTALEWGGHNLHSDHLDGDMLNNDPNNLVPSCATCNIRRAKVGNPMNWDGTVIRIKTSGRVIFATQSWLEEND